MKNKEESGLYFFIGMWSGWLVGFMLPFVSTRVQVFTLDPIINLSQLHKWVNEFYRLIVISSLKLIRCCSLKQISYTNNKNTTYFIRLARYDCCWWWWCFSVNSNIYRMKFIFKKSNSCCCCYFIISQF